jgi:hypothetical protein
VTRIAAFVLAALAGLASLQGDFARELDEAKALYRDGRFGQTIATLQTLVLRLQSDEGSRAPAIEAEAHLYTGLAYVALDDPEAAKASFERLLRLAPDRRLDPDVYAPKVIALFEEARTRARTSPVATRAPAAGNTTTTSITTTAPGPASGGTAEGRSRLPWAFLGGAVGAGGALVLGELSHASTSTTTAPPLTTTTTAPPSIEVDSRLNGLKQGTFSCSQALVLSIDVINNSTTLTGVDGFDVTLNTTSAECITHRPGVDGTVLMDVLPGARVQIRQVDLRADLCASPGRVPGCGWRAVVVVVTSRGSFEDEVVFNTIP